MPDLCVQRLFAEEVRVLDDLAEALRGVAQDCALRGQGSLSRLDVALLACIGGLSSLSLPRRLPLWVRSICKRCLEVV